MRVPDIDDLISEAEKASPDYHDPARLVFSSYDEEWANWAAEKLKIDQEELDKLPSLDKILQISPATSELSGVTWTITTSDKANTQWVDGVPVTLSAPAITAPPITGSMTVSSNTWRV